MKLRTFDKVNVAPVTRYHVFRGEEAVDSFVVDYQAEENNLDKLRELIKAGAEVRFVDTWYPVPDCLFVHVSVN